MDKRGGISIWDILIWVGIILLLGWALLKSFGVINFPVWVEMIPYFGIGSAGVGVAYKLGRIMKGVEMTNRKVNGILRMEEDFKEVKSNQKLCMDGKLHKSPYR